MQLIRRLILTIRRKAAHGSYKYLWIKLMPLLVLLIFFLWKYDLYFMSDKSMDGFFAVGSTLETTCDRGDVILFSTDNGDQIRRIIGLPGDKITFENGTLYINGIKCDETKYCNGNTYAVESYTVPEGMCFVLSDNRMFEDSRFYGCIDVKNIKEHICALF